MRGRETADGSMTVVPVPEDLVSAAASTDPAAVLGAAACAALFRYRREDTLTLRLAGAVFRPRITSDMSFHELLTRLTAAPATEATGDAILVEVRQWPSSNGSAAEIELLVATGALPAGGVPEWLAALRCLLRHAITEPATRIGALRMLDHEVARRTVAAANAGASGPAPATTMQHRFERFASEHPDRIALLAGDHQVSYGELNTRAERFAAQLSELGAGPERPVGVLVDRSPELVVALLAAAKCGAPFVPLDRRMPPKRIRTILGLAEASLVIGAEEILGGLGVSVVSEPPADQVVHSGPLRAVSPEAAAYIYFTSGSTGRPKGVVIDHRCAAGRVDWIARRYRLGPGSVVLHKTPLIFDVAVIEIMAPLSAGATVRLAARHGEADVGELIESLRGKQVTFVHFVPSMLKAFLAGAEEEAFPGVQWVQTSGEAMPARLLDGVRGRFPNAEFHSAYGQTETSEVAGWVGESYPAGAVVPVGEQVGGYRVLVLDDALNPVPCGVPGEICVAGVGGLARGYHNQPALTAERFVPNPYPLEPGERLYRTGDLGAYDASGQILFLGREDTQTKIRGARVEPAEVDAVLADGPRVRDCAVIARRDESTGDNELIAYVVGRDVSVAELTEWAAGQLPSFMVPSAYVLLDRLPYTGSGKLDRAKLPAPTAKDRAVRAASAGSGPRSRLEEELCRLCASLLGIERIDPTEDFFATGGNSLKATQMLIRIKALYGVRLPVAEFFADSTVRGLGVVIERLLIELVSSLSQDEAARRLTALEPSRG